jgi:type IV pilus assembly protein PilO
MAPPAAATQSTFAKMSPTVKAVLGVALLGIVAFGYWFAFYTDVDKKIDAAKNQTGTLKQELNRQTEAQQSFLVDRDELAAKQAKAPDFNKILPAESQEAAFLSSVQAAANASGIDLKGWQPLEEAPQPLYAKVPMRLELKGRFHQIIRFMYEIGRVDRIINIENIELIEPVAVGDDMVVKGKCLATAFHTSKVAVAPSASGAPGAPPPGGKR